MTREDAFNLVTEMLQSPNLVKHCLAVESIMRGLAVKLKEMHPELPAEEFNEEEWEIVGLLHDADYEVTNKDLETHTNVIVQKLRAMGEPERVVQAILAHHPLKRNSRDNYLEKAIFAADELSGLITAVALVKPDKKLSSVTVDSVMKKFYQKEFAKGALREQIVTCDPELGIPLEEFVGIALKSMQSISSDLGL